MGLILTSSSRKSSFLNRPEFLDGQIDKSVLILGGDWMGDEIAKRLAKLGLDVTVVSGGLKDDLKVNRQDNALDSIYGQIGRFYAGLSLGKERLTRQFGFVVASPPAEKIPRFNYYGLEKDTRVCSISELEKLVDAGEALPRRAGDWYHAAFIDDLVGDSDPSTFDRFIKLIERLGQVDNFQPYVFTKYLKVAGPDLEKRYRELRRNGVIFFKFDETPPVFQKESGKWKILFTEPLLKLDFELNPDIIVVDEELTPPLDLAEKLGHLLPLDTCRPYVQSESPRFNSVLTSKAGLLAVGPSRGVFDEQSIRDDIDSVELEIKKSLNLLKETSGKIPSIDKSKCAFCLTCLRLCPHGAITFYQRAEISSLACLRCGICVVECPMGAISFQSEPEKLPESSGEILEDCRGRIALFLCSRSAAQAFKAIEFIYQDDVVVFEVNCAGSIEPQRMVDAFKSGATAVLIGGCFKGNCASLYGNILCSGRLDNIRSWLSVSNSVLVTEPGLTSKTAHGPNQPNQRIAMDRLRFVQTAGNTPDVLARAISDLKKNVR